MKRKIVGLSEEVLHWKDKNTGKQKHGFSVFVTGKAKGVVGVKSISLFIDDKFLSFSEVATDIDYGRHDRYIDTECSVEYNEKGYLEDIEFNPKPLGGERLYVNFMILSLLLRILLLRIV